jgi:exodeoxyribonuclease VII large subunit
LTQRLRDGQQKADHARDSLTRRLGGVLVDARRWFESRTQALQSHSPLRELSARRELVALMTRRLAAIPPHAIEAARQRFRHVDGIIRVLGPNATLGRGYSITSDAKGTIIRSVETISRGQALTTQVTDGTFDSKVSER